MSLPRVVLDSDVLVAAMRSPHGASAELVLRALDGRLQLVACVALIIEYEAVTLRPSQLAAMKRTSAQMATVLGDLAAMVQPVQSFVSWRPQLQDPDDEMVLEADANGRADALISFNHRDFGAAPSRFGIWLATLGEFLRSLPP